MLPQAWDVDGKSLGRAEVLLRGAEVENKRRCWGGGGRGGRASSDWAPGLERGILRGEREGAEDSRLLSVHPIRSSFNKHWQAGCGDGGPAD